MKTICLLLITGLMSISNLCFSSTEEPTTMDKQKTNPVVLIKTSLGDIKVELNAEKAPVTVKNFLDYTQENFYDHTIFHRVIPGFMIQGGGFTADLKQKTTHAPIKNEAENGLLNERGTLAMARTSDVNSATGQFFINTVDNAFLNFKGKSPQTYGYCVFGKVIQGMDVVDKIAKVPTSDKGPHQNVPVQPVEILSVTVL